MSQNAVQRKQHVDKVNQLSLVRQYELLKIHRSGLYYQSVPETTFNLELMHQIDEKHMLHPWLGVPRMTQWLRKDLGYIVNHKRIERLYGLLGIQEFGPKPNTSKPEKGHYVYPYLLQKLPINRINHVWAMDITYIPVEGGYLYFVAVIDLYSRFVLNWLLSNAMISKRCRQTLEEAVRQYEKPEIVNTDLGSQFTAEEFTQ